MGYNPRVLSELTNQISKGASLNDQDVRLAIQELVSQFTSAEAKADFLIALARKGETVDEIACFARELRAKSLSPELDPETRSREILDVCGTGGDHLQTFNISTTVALIAAAAGLTVAKHGNRAITSQAGSADVLEALGIKIDLEPAPAARSLKEHGFAFFFAPKYHPAFRHIAPARKLCAERGQRTIFNFLGPLLNPARPTAQLTGVPHPRLCEPVARVLQTLGARRAMVVSGAVTMMATNSAKAASHLDELSTLGATSIAEFYQDRAFACSTLTVEHFPLQPACLEDLKGGDRHQNAEIVRELLRGKELGPKRDATLLNAGAALFVGGRVRSLAEGWDLAAELIDSGRAYAKLQSLAAASQV